MQTNERVRSYLVLLQLARVLELLSPEDQPLLSGMHPHQPKQPFFQLEDCVFLVGPDYQFISPVVDANVYLESLGRQSLLLNDVDNAALSYSSLLQA